MVEEYSPIMKKDVWDIMLRPEGNPVVSSKWIYKIKHTTKGMHGEVQDKVRGKGVLPKRGS